MNTPRLQGLYRDEKNQASRVASLAAKALRATNSAEDARRDAADGKYDKSRVERTEITRQKAVNELEKARLKLMETQARIADYGYIRMRNGGQTIEWIDLDMKAIQRRKAGWGLGVPKETKDGEHRVGLTPAAVTEIVRQGHEVVVQQGAGAGYLSGSSP